MKVLIAIPCYNCSTQVSRVLSEFDTHLLSRIERVIVIDNCSSDNTFKVATQIAQIWPKGKIEIIQNSRNLGLGGTHKIAFQKAILEGVQYLGVLHGDHQATTGELHLLLDRAQSDPDFSAVLGARFMNKSKLKGYSLVRILGNRILNLLYTLFSFRATYDLGSGINLFRVEDLKEINFLEFSDAFTFNMDLLLEYYRRRAKLEYVPITWSETDQISNAKTFRVGWIALCTLLRWRFKVSEHEASQRIK